MKKHYARSGTWIMHLKFIDVRLRGFYTPFHHTLQLLQEKLLGMDLLIRLPEVVHQGLDQIRHRRHKDHSQMPHISEPEIITYSVTRGMVLCLCHLQMILIARETTNEMMIKARIASSIIRNFARCERGTVSVGLKAVAPVKAR